MPSTGLVLGGIGKFWSLVVERKKKRCRLETWAELRESFEVSSAPLFHYHFHSFAHLPNLYKLLTIFYDFSSSDYAHMHHIQSFIL